MFCCYFGGLDHDIGAEVRYSGPKSGGADEKTARWEENVEIVVYLR